MNSADNNSLIQTTRPINYDISKSLERKVSLDLTSLIDSYKKLLCVMNRVFLNIRSENKNLWESFKHLRLLIDFVKQLKF